MAGNMIVRQAFVGPDGVSERTNAKKFSTYSSFQLPISSTGVILPFNAFRIDAMQTNFAIVIQTAIWVTRDEQIHT
jgi:hypothetical protein